MASGREVGGHGPMGPAGPAGPAGEAGPPGSAANPVNWYVDSEFGDGANSGETADAPLQTIAELLAKTISAGANIWLARGSFWREEITGLPVGCSVMAYGRGLPPLLACDDVAANGSWTKTGGRTNVYQIAWTVPSNSNGNRHCVWEDDVRLTRVADVAAVDSTPGSFYAPQPPTAGPDTIYIHASDSSDVTANAKVYELAKRGAGVTSSQGGSLIGLHSRRNAGSAGSIISYHYAKDCIAEDGGTHNMWVEGMAEDCTAWKSEQPPNYGGSTMFVTYASVGGALGRRGATYRRCRAIGSQVKATLGYYYHTDGSGLIGQMAFEDCEAIACHVGFAGTNVEIASYRNCRAYRCITGIDVNASTTLSVVGGALISGHGLTAVQDGMANAVSNPSSTGNLYMRGVRVVLGGNTNMGAIKARIADIERCTFAVIGPPGGEYYWAVFGDNGTGRTLNYQRNVAYNMVYALYLGASGNTITSDYNVWYRASGGATFQVNGSTYNTPALWNAASGQDANSVTTDPEFIGQPQNGDTRTSTASAAYTLQAGADYEDWTQDTEQWRLFYTYGLNR